MKSQLESLAKQLESVGEENSDVADIKSILLSLIDLLIEKEEV
jgi:hypothetical protein